MKFALQMLMSSSTLFRTYWIKNLAFLFFTLSSFLFVGCGDDNDGHNAAAKYLESKINLKSLFVQVDKNYAFVVLMYYDNYKDHQISQVSSCVLQEKSGTSKAIGCAFEQATLASLNSLKSIFGDQLDVATFSAILPNLMQVRITEPRLDAGDYFVEFQAMDSQGQTTIAKMDLSLKEILFAF